MMTTESRRRVLGRKVMGSDFCLYQITQVATLGIDRERRQVGKVKVTVVVQVREIMMDWTRKMLIRLEIRGLL